MRWREAELPPGREMPRISARSYGAVQTRRALPRVAPGLRMDVGVKGPASVTDCMSTESESPSPAQREKVPEGRIRVREPSDALLLTLAVRARAQTSSLRSRPHPALRAHSSRSAGDGLSVPAAAAPPEHACRHATCAGVTPPLAPPPHP